MPRLSAGLLLHRTDPSEGMQVLLVHPGGPFWARKDRGAWSIPKGEHDADEEPLAAAYREFAEELGLAPPDGVPADLGAVRQPSGKVVTAYALAADLDLSGFCSNTFDLKWPHSSGRVQSFPEVDRAEWMSLPRAREQLLAGQVPFLDRLVDLTSS